MYPNTLRLWIYPPKRSERVSERGSESVSGRLFNVDPWVYTLVGPTDAARLSNTIQADTIRSLLSH